MNAFAYRTTSLCLALFVSAVATMSAQSPPVIDARTFGAIEARHIGPAAMSGRISAIDGSALDPRILYVGSAGGGVWKTTNGGNTFKSVFDEYTQSIGTITIDQARPDTVWVGTGETWVRNSVSVGTGIYRTTDGGETWKAMGLENTEHIGRIAIDPKNPSTIYVAALGHVWNDNEERGVYKSTDGGATWRRTLYVDAKTGCADLEVDPKNPKIVYASMWQFRRTAWSFSSGGPGSGLFKSTDGGETWKRLTKGLPEGELGRIAIAIAPSKPEVVYATVEAEKSAIYRSDDRGENWEKGSSDFSVIVRPFYFAHLVVDPKDHLRLYKPGLSLSVSKDGGETFSSPFGEGGNVHSDLHAIWIDPTNPTHLTVGTDGGVYTSVDRGNSWRFIRNLPVSQFYHVTLDMQTPYNVYGGLQDNGSWRGPSATSGGIRNSDWHNVGFGDGFQTIADPFNNDIVYCESQGGDIIRRNLKTGEFKDIKPVAEEGEKELRFNWNTPIMQSPRPGVMYMGSQFLHRTTDRGESWVRVSGDLTTNDPAKLKQLKSGGLTVDNSSAENHCTIFTISESPLDSTLVWVGTDDGNVQVTGDGGRNWTNVRPNITGLPANTWCSGIEASHHDRSTAYATFDGHTTGDMKSYIYRTTDLGKSWQSLATDSVRGYAHVVREDQVNARLLFVGTEFGLYVSIDGGMQWARFTGNLPQVAVRDIAIHPRESDVVLATHGRGVIIIDDITPLRNMTPDVLAAKIAILPSRPSVNTLSTFGQGWEGDDEFVGRGPTDAAVITYYMRDRHVFGDFKVEIADSTGNLIATLPGGKRKGINRVIWAMQMKPPKVAPTPGTESRFVSGPTVAEGNYIVRILRGKDTTIGSLKIVGDPKSPHSAEDRAFRHTTVMKLYAMQGDLAFIADAVVGARDQAKARSDSRPAGDPLAGGLTEISEKLDTLYHRLVATSEGWLAREEQLRERVIDLYSSVSGYAGRPTESQLARMKILESNISEAERELQSIIGPPLQKINTDLQGRGKEPIKLLTREEFDKKEDATTGSGGGEMEWDEDSVGNSRYQGFERLMQMQR
jgi:photosystem II stability/assembly factor-like uncharacterized protein